MVDKKLSFYDKNEENYEERYVVNKKIDEFLKNVDKGGFIIEIG